MNENMMNIESETGGERIEHEYEKKESKTHKILIVDDEKDVLEALALTLQSAEQFDSMIFTAQDAETAIQKMEKHEIDLILSDYKMPNMNGIDFLNKVMNKYPQQVRMLITGYSDIEIAKEAINKAQIHNYIEKPWDNDDLILTVYEALKRKDERDTDKIYGVNSIKEAIKLVKEFQNDPLNFQLKEQMQEEKLMFEFYSINEFNKFSFEIKNFKNVYIKDVNVFENKFLITVGVLPKSFDDVLMYRD